MVRRVYYWTTKPSSHYQNCFCWFLQWYCAMGKQPIICEYLYLFILNYPESHTLITCSGVLISHVTGHDIFNIFFRYFRDSWFELDRKYFGTAEDNPVTYCSSTQGNILNCTTETSVLFLKLFSVVVRELRFYLRNFVIHIFVFESVFLVGQKLSKFASKENDSLCRSDLTG